MHKNKYLYITLLSVLGFNTEVLSAQDTIKYAPRLVVNITIDQLRSDYLEAFTPLYGKGGFKRWSTIMPLTPSSPLIVLLPFRQSLLASHLITIVLLVKNGSTKRHCALCFALKTNGSPDRIHLFRCRCRQSAMNLKWPPMDSQKFSQLLHRRMLLFSQLDMLPMLPSGWMISAANGTPPSIT